MFCVVVFPMLCGVCIGPVDLCEVELDTIIEDGWKETSPISEVS